MTKIDIIPCVAYPRVSSGAQAKADTIAAQHISLPKFIGSRAADGWKLVKPVAYYEDNGRSASGKLDRRDGWLRLLADAKAGLFQMVVIRSFTRMTRTGSWRERADLIAPLQEAKIKLAVASLGPALGLKHTGGIAKAETEPLIDVGRPTRRSLPALRWRREGETREEHAECALQRSLAQLYCWPH